MWHRLYWHQQTRAVNHSTRWHSDFTTTLCLCATSAANHLCSEGLQHPLILSYGER
jgi:hypothetical protein